MGAGLKSGKGIEMESRTVEVRRRHGLGLLQGGMLRALSMVGLASLAGPVTSRPAYVHPGFKVWETTEKRDRRPLLAGNRGKGTRRQRKADKAVGVNLRHHAICRAVRVGRNHFRPYQIIRQMLVRKAGR